MVRNRRTAVLWCMADLLDQACRLSGVLARRLMNTMQGWRYEPALVPYLLQHADNPVDWYPWGEEAFAEARRGDVALLISIGYAACHWCHVSQVGP